MDPLPNQTVQIRIRAPRRVKDLIYKLAVRDGFSLAGKVTQLMINEIHKEFPDQDIT